METTFSKSESRSSKIVNVVLLILLLLSVVAVVVLTLLLKEELNREEVEWPNTNPPDICDGNTIDVAVIGAGASGTFSAWKLSQKYPDWTIRIYDTNDRIGGRLYSIPIQGIDNHKADVGAMRFDSRHTRLNRTIHELGLKVDLFTTPDENNTLHYLRDKLLSKSDISSGNVPYKMTEMENHLIKSHRNALKAYWNSLIIANETWLLEDYDKVCNDGEMAYEKGIYSAYASVGTTEAIEYVAASAGFVGAFYRNMNYAQYGAYTTYIPGGPPRQMYTIRKGFQELTEQMVDRFLQNPKNSLHLHHKLNAVTQHGDLELLTFYDKSRFEISQVCARKVILGLPVGALKQIQFDKDIEMAMRSFSGSVISAVAGKTYLAYDRPWWRSEGQGTAFDELRQQDIDLKYIITDTPVGMLLDIGVDNTTGKALLLSYFVFEKSTYFWEPYQLQQKNEGNNEGFIRIMNKQLSKIFNISESELPQPYAVASYSWHEAPYWTAWHNSAPGYNIPVLKQRAMRPVQNKDIYLVGEAFSNYNGWTEGALETAEAMLSTYFGITEF